MGTFLSTQLEFQRSSSATNAASSSSSSSSAWCIDPNTPNNTKTLIAVYQALLRQVAQCQLSAAQVEAPQVVSLSTLRARVLTEAMFLHPVLFSSPHVSAARLRACQSEPNSAFATAMNSQLDTSQDVPLVVSCQQTPYMVGDGAGRASMKVEAALRDRIIMSTASSHCPIFVSGLAPKGSDTDDGATDGISLPPALACAYSVGDCSPDSRGRARASVVSAATFEWIVNHVGCALGLDRQLNRGAMGAAAWESLAPSSWATIVERQRLDDEYVWVFGDDGPSACGGTSAGSRALRIVAAELGAAINALLHDVDITPRPPPFADRPLTGSETMQLVLSRLLSSPQLGGTTASEAFAEALAESTMLAYNTLRNMLAAPFAGHRQKGNSGGGGGGARRKDSVHGSPGGASRKFSVLAVLQDTRRPAAGMSGDGASQAAVAAMAAVTASKVTAANGAGDVRDIIKSIKDKIGVSVTTNASPKGAHSESDGSQRLTSDDHWRTLLSNIKVAAPLDKEILNLEADVHEDLRERLDQLADDGDPESYRLTIDVLRSQRREQDKATRQLGRAAWEASCFEGAVSHWHSADSHDSPHNTSTTPRRHGSKSDLRLLVPSPPPSATSSQRRPRLGSDSLSALSSSGATHDGPGAAPHSRDLSAVRDKLRAYVALTQNSSAEGFGRASSPTDGNATATAPPSDLLNAQRTLRALFQLALDEVATELASLLVSGGDGLKSKPSAKTMGKAPDATTEPSSVVRAMDPPRIEACFKQLPPRAAHALVQITDVVDLTSALTRAQQALGLRFHNGAVTALRVTVAAPTSAAAHDASAVAHKVSILMPLSDGTWVHLAVEARPTEDVVRMGSLSEALTMIAEHGTVDAGLTRDAHQQKGITGRLARELKDDDGDDEDEDLQPPSSSAASDESKRSRVDAWLQRKALLHADLSHTLLQVSNAREERRRGLVSLKRRLKDGELAPIQDADAIIAAVEANRPDLATRFGDAKDSDDSDDGWGSTRPGSKASFRRGNSSKALRSVDAEQGAPTVHHHHPNRHVDKPSEDKVASQSFAQQTASWKQHVRNVPTPVRSASSLHIRRPRSAAGAATPLVSRTAKLDRSERGDAAFVPWVVLFAQPPPIEAIEVSLRAFDAVDATAVPFADTTLHEYLLHHTTSLMSHVFVASDTEEQLHRLTLHDVDFELVDAPLPRHAAAVSLTPSRIGAVATATDAPTTRWTTTTSAVASLLLPPRASERGTSTIQPQWIQVLRPPCEVGQVSFALTCLLEVDFRAKPAQRKLAKLDAHRMLLVVLSDMAGLPEHLRCRAARVILASSRDRRSVAAYHANGAEWLVVDRLSRLSTALLDDEARRGSVTHEADMMQTTVVLCLIGATMCLSASACQQAFFDAAAHVPTGGVAGVFSSLCRLVTSNRLASAATEWQVPLMSAVSLFANALCVLRVPGTSVLPRPRLLAPFVADASAMCRRFASSGLHHASIDVHVAVLHALVATNAQITAGDTAWDGLISFACNVVCEAIPVAVATAQELVLAASQNGMSNSSNASISLDDGTTVTLTEAHCRVVLACIMLLTNALRHASQGRRDATAFMLATKGIVQRMRVVICGALQRALPEVQHRPGHDPRPVSLLPLFPSLPITMKTAALSDEDNSSDDDAGSQRYTRGPRSSRSGTSYQTGTSQHSKRSSAASWETGSAASGGGLGSSRAASEKTDRPYEVLDTFAPTVLLVQYGVALVRWISESHASKHGATVIAEVKDVAQWLLGCVQLDGALFPPIAGRKDAMCAAEIRGMTSPLCRLVNAIREDCLASLRCLSEGGQYAWLAHPDAAQILLSCVDTSGRVDVASNAAGVLAAAARQGDTGNQEAWLTSLAGLLNRSEGAALQQPAVRAFANVIDLAEGSGGDSALAEKATAMLLPQCGRILGFATVAEDSIGSSTLMLAADACRLLGALALHSPAVADVLIERDAIGCVLASLFVATSQPAGRPSPVSPTPPTSGRSSNLSHSLQRSTTPSTRIRSGTQPSKAGSASLTLDALQAHGFFAVECLLVRTIKRDNLGHASRVAESRDVLKNLVLAIGRTTSADGAVGEERMVPALVLWGLRLMRSLATYVPSKCVQQLVDLGAPRHLTAVLGSPLSDAPSKEVARDVLVALRRFQNRDPATPTGLQPQM